MSQELPEKFQEIERRPFRLRDMAEFIGISMPNATVLIQRANERGIGVRIDDEWRLSRDEMFRVRTIRDAGIRFHSTNLK